MTPPAKTVYTNAPVAGYGGNQPTNINSMGTAPQLANPSYPPTSGYNKGMGGYAPPVAPLKPYPTSYEQPQMQQPIYDSRGHYPNPAYDTRPQMTYPQGYPVASYQPQQRNMPQPQMTMTYPHSHLQPHMQVHTHSQPAYSSAQMYQIPAMQPPNQQQQAKQM